MKNILLIACCLIAIQVRAQNKDEQAIQKLLTRQVTEWNKGSIEGYMKGYWNNDSLLFIGSHGPRYGYKETLEKYKAAYPDADHMGILTSTVKSMKRLCPDYYFIVGSWALQRKAGNVSGSYTLLFHKVKGEWVIVVDHSS